MTSEPGSRTDIGLRSTAYTALKMAVVAPVARLSVTRAVTVKPEDAANCR
jgi:hypothetical protein